MDSHRCKHPMKVFISTAIFSMLIFFAGAQLAVTKMWDYRYGGSGFDFPSILLKTSDHGFLIAGSSLSSIGFDKSEDCRNGLDYWIVKTDSAGVLSWNKTYGGSETDNLTSIIQLPDSGYLLGGYSISGNSGDKSRDNFGYPVVADDYWIVRTDKNGNKLWDRSFGGDKKDRLNSLLLLPDGNYLLGGYSFSDSTGDMSHHKFGDNDFWIVKVDPNGNKIWDMNVGSDFDDRLVAMTNTPDGNIILAGYSNSSTGIFKSQPPCNGSYDYWIVKIDQSGNKIWDRTFGGKNKDEMTCMTILPSGKMFFAGATFPGTGCEKTQSNWGTLGYCDFWVVCTDINGNQLWDRVYGGDRNEDDINNITLCSEGLLLSGCSYSFTTGNKTEDNILSGEQPWMFSIDTLGNFLWDKTIHNPTHAELGYAIQDDDGCFVFLSNVNLDGGFVSQSRNSADDYWLAKFCPANAPVEANYISSTNAICQNYCIDFTNLSRHATSYQWLFPGGNPSTDTSANPQSICYYGSGSYDVTLIARNSSETDTMKLYGYITVYPEIPFSPIRQSGDTLFSIPGLAQYNWYRDTSLISGANEYYYVATENGNYAVVVSDTNGCQASASILQIYTGLHETGKDVPFSAQFKSGVLHIYAGGPSQNVFIELTDALGRMIYQDNLLLQNGENVKELPVEYLQKGIYFIRVRSQKQLLTFKIY
jgi:hypothetical protein